MRDDFRDFLRVRVNILAGDIRHELLIAKALPVEYQALLLALQPRPVAFRPKKDAQLKRHVESRQLACRVQFRSTDIVDAVRALLDELHDFIDTRAAAVIDLSSTASHKSTSDYGEYQGIEELLVFAIEWTVYENTKRGNFRHQNQSLKKMNP